jgi:hypothetical protein
LNRLTKIVAVSALGCVAWTVYSHGRAVHPADGVLVGGRPRQDNYEEARPLVHIGDWTLTPQARYDITGRILAAVRYEDGWSDLSPLDLSLGWGLMSDNEFLAQLDIFEVDRTLHEPGKPEYQTPDYYYVLLHSSNNHVIPLNESIRAQLFALRVGQVVELTGDLVDARGRGAFIPTSLSRYDNGDNACEVMLVRGVQVKN